MKKTCLLIVLLFVSFLFVGCGGGKEISTEGQYQIYKLAQESGYSGTYEEWLESIKGENGTPVELVVERGMLYWRYRGDSKLQPLFDLYM